MKMASSDYSLTQEKLKELLHYNPETGIFTWLVDRNQHVKAGDIAGYKRSDGYIRICINGERYLSHRIAWLYIYGSFPDDQIDHINHKRHHNIIKNIRDAGYSENTKNRTINKNNTSGCCGVSWRKDLEKWSSLIDVSKKRITLGYFIDYFEAVCARKSAEYKYGFHPNHGKSI